LILKVRDWLYEKFISFGIDSVWLHHYHDDSDQWNVVATVVGTAKPDKVIVVGGHYDSIVRGTGTDPLVWAPGADDNATGTAATLEMARIIALNPLPVTVMFVPFAQEEQGLIGSDYFAEYLNNNNTDVELMINSDMIAHSVDPDPDVIIYADPSAMEFVNIMIQMAKAYTYLDPSYKGAAATSDHHSFYEWGYDAVFAHEGDFFSFGWHKNYDVVDSLNFPYMKEVVKMCLGTLWCAATEEEVKVPDSFSLSQNYPNPFNSETVIEYSLPQESQVKMAIYNILGQRVKTLLEQKETAGYKRVIWDGKNEKGQVAGSGIYFYRMETGEFVQTKKMVLLK
jgi:hypothetical protein